MSDSSKRIVRVIPLLRLPRGHDCYDYEWTEALFAPCKGQLVRVSFRNRLVKAVVWDVPNDPVSPSPIRPILAVLSPTSVITAYQFALCNWIARQSFCARSTVLLSMIRSGGILQSKKLIVELPQEETRDQQRLVVSRAYIPLPWRNAVAILKQRLYDAHTNGRSLLVLFPTYNDAQWMRNTLPMRYRSWITMIHTQESSKHINEAWRTLHRKKQCIVFGSRLALYAPWSQAPDVIIMNADASQYDHHEQNPRIDVRIACQWISDQCHTNFTMIGWPAPLMAWHWKELKTCSWSGALPDRPDIERIAREKPPRWANGLELLHPQTLEMVGDDIEQKRHTIILVHNRQLVRRILCRDCGSVIRCPHCDHALQLITQQLLRCMYCRFERNEPPTCDRCGNAALKMIGTNFNEYIERLQSQWSKESFGWIDEERSWRKEPPLVIVSTVRGIEQLKELLDTQSRPSLLIIANVDALLNAKGFQSTEFAYNTLMECELFMNTAKQPTMIIETTQPNHPIWNHWKNKPYKEWYNNEIAERSAFHYPPTSTILRLTLKHRDTKKAQDLANGWYNRMSALIATHHLNAEAISPYQCYPARRGPLWQWCAAIKIHDHTGLELLEEVLYNEPTQIVIDRNIL